MFNPTQTLTGDGDDLRLVDLHTIPQEHIDSLSDYRKAASAMSRSKELHRVSSIPVIFVHKWMREGFNIYEKTAAQIVAKLRQDDLHAFITTEKRV